MKKEKINVKSITMIGMFTAVLAILSIVTIPLPTGVPVTLQTFAIPLCGFVLGKKKGTISTLLYLLLGFFGVPVFAGMTGGAACLIGLSGGFLFGYIPFSFLAGLGTQFHNRLAAIGFGVLGLVICHLFGVIQYGFLTNTPFFRSLILVSLPYIVKDIVSVVFAYVAAIAVRKGLASANIMSYDQAA